MVSRNIKRNKKKVDLIKFIEEIKNLQIKKTKISK